MCVLIVEDELLIRMGLAMFLEEAGHEVMCAPDGPAAVELAAQYPGKFSAVVTDYHMPGGMNGADVVTHMRESYPTIPVFITTALTSVVPEDWRKRHSVTLVAKPYRGDSLVDAIGVAMAFDGGCSRSALDR